MTIEYEMTREDYLNFNLIHLEHSKTAKRTISIQRFFVPVVYIALSFVLSWTSNIPFWYWFIVFLIASIGWIIFFPKYTRRIILRRVSKMLDEGKNKGMLGMQQLSLMEDGIFVNSEYKESKSKWSSIEDIVLTDNYILVYVSAVMAHVIPVRAFSSEADMDDFVTMLKEKAGLVD